MILSRENEALITSSFVVVFPACFGVCFVSQISPIFHFVCFLFKLKWLADQFLRFFSNTGAVAGVFSVHGLVGLALITNGIQRRCARKFDERTSRSDPRSCFRRTRPTWWPNRIWMLRMSIKAVLLGVVALPWLHLLVRRGGVNE